MKKRTILKLLGFSIVIAITGFSIIACETTQTTIDSQAAASQSDNWNNWIALPDSLFGANNSVLSIAWGGPAGQQRFVALGSSSRVPFAYSEDGINWTAQVHNDFITITSPGKRIIWGNNIAGLGMFLFTWSSIDYYIAFNELNTSLDGETYWVKANLEFNIWDNGTHNINSTAWGGPAGRERFVAMGHRFFLFSADGVNWSREMPNNNYSGLVWGGPAGQQRFIAGSSLLERRMVFNESANREIPVYNAKNEIVIICSNDGENWELLSDGPVHEFGNNSYINDITWGGHAGQQKYVAVFGDGLIAYSANGETWTAVSGSPFGNNSINAIVWGGPAGRERFVAVGNNGRIAFSIDGETWLSVFNSTFGNENINDITWGGPAGQQCFVAVGNNGKMAYLSF